MIHPSRTSRVAVLAALLIACSGPTEPVDIGGVTAALRSGRIEITNRTTKPVFTFVIGGNAAMLALWAACADPAVCQPLEPGGRRIEDWPSPLSGKPETTALIHWWHSVATPDGYRPDSIRVGALHRDTPP